MTQSLTIGASGNKTNTTLFIGSSGNKKVTEAWIGDGVGNEQFYTGLSATDDGPADNDGSGGTRAPVVGDITVTPADGSGGNTILWTYSSGDTEISIDDTTSFATFWTSTTVPAPGYSASWTYTVTDDHGVVASGTVAVNMDSGV